MGQRAMDAHLARHAEPSDACVEVDRVVEERVEAAHLMREAIRAHQSQSVAISRDQMHSGALREPTWMFVGGSRRSTSSDANAGERRGSDHFSGPPSPPSYAAAKACKRFEGRMVSAPNVIREGDGDRMRLRTGQMRSIASGMEGSSASSAVLPSTRFAYGPLVLPVEGCNQ